MSTAFQLSLIFTQASNDVCVDCRRKIVAGGHVDVSHGVFLCEHCADIHKSLGQQVNRIKSLLDDFSQVRW